MIHPEWRTIRGLGFGSTELQRWTWHCIQMLLGVTTDADTGIRWGDSQSDATNSKVFSVHKDPQWVPTVDRLQTDMRRLRHIRDEQSEVIDHIGVDMFAWVTWLLSRTEEYGSEKDLHGRFCQHTSLAALAGYAHQPIIDEMVKTLRQSFLQHCRSINVGVREHSPWPAGKKAALWVSHDVDNAEPRPLPVAVRKAIGAVVSRDPVVRSRRWRETGYLLRRPPVNPYWQMDQIAVASHDAHCPTTFFFLPHTTRRAMEGSRRIRRYRLKQRRIVELIKRLAANGSEIGLHVSYNAHEDPTGISSDLQIFQDAASFGPGTAGARCHYLRFDVPETWRREEAAGITYDSSLGWSSGWGFRSGSALPYRPFDLQTGRQLNIWELEVNVMDVAVTSSAFIGAAGQVMSTIQNTGGCAGILIHPTPWDGRTAVEHLNIHRALIDQLSDEAVWLSTPSAIIEAMEDYEMVVTSPQDTGLDERNDW